MRTLKLFLENFDRSSGKISYAVEDERGNRVARAEVVDDNLKNIRLETMDCFILSFLPKLKEMKASLEVQGPMSHALSLLVGEYVSSALLVEGGARQYTKEDIDVFTQTFRETQDLNKTLAKVFNYFK